MSKDNDKWINIARAGTWTASSGERVNLTVQDFQEAADGYDPSVQEAPLVIGHPKDNQPAYGWISGLRRTGDVLQARVSRLTDGVREMVENANYRYVSPSFNRTGGRFSLRHVGLLGAVPPAIKGLGPVALAAEDEGVTVAFDFGEPQPSGGSMTIEELQRKLGEMEAKYETLSQELETVKAENAGLKESLSKAETAKSQAEADFSEYKAGQVKKERDGRLEKLVREGKVLPAEKSDVLNYAEALSNVAEPVEFSDGSKESAEERYWKTLEARQASPLLMDFSAPAQGGRAEVTPDDYRNKV